MENVLFNTTKWLSDLKEETNVRFPPAISIGEYEILNTGEVNLGTSVRRTLDGEKIKLGQKNLTLSEHSVGPVAKIPKNSYALPSLLQWILKTSSSRYTLVSFSFWYLAL